jgi:predicted MFS family arabinose efflux permease
LKFLNSYKKLPRFVLILIFVEFCIQLVNATFLNLQSIYMTNVGFTEAEVGGFISYRYLGVFLLAIPIGIAQGKKAAKFFFYLSALLVPIFAICILFSIQAKSQLYTSVFQFLWGASFTFIQIPILPFILRRVSPEAQTAGISLHYSTYSFGGILSGLLIFFFEKANAQFFDEFNTLLIITIISLTGFFTLVFTKDDGKETDAARAKKRMHFNDYDWKLIFRALTPTFIIAVGAGLTIPFISLFFEKVHHVYKGEFSIYSTIAAVLVAISSLLVPTIKKNIGYQIAVPFTQSLAIMALVALATTQFYSQINIAVGIAVFCYLLRQPLMNLAGPMTAEVEMNYVGEKNREIVSALTSAIWSGSWFVSGSFFKVMFSHGFSYVNVFLITCSLYAVGVIWFYFLILDYNKRTKAQTRKM